MTPDQATNLLALHNANVDAAINYALNTSRHTAKVQSDLAEEFHRYVNSLTEGSAS
jgi:hypothetical protein